MLTATEDEIAAFPASVWTEMKERLNLEKADVSQRYHKRRLDWQPFGGSEGIETLVGKLLDDLNGLLSEKKYHLETVGEDFWTSDDAAERYRGHLVSDYSLLVVDPVSLRAITVLERLNLLLGCFENEKCVISVLPPFGPFPAIQGWRRLMRSAGGQLFKDFVEPEIPPKRLLDNCGFCLHDEEDIKRLMRVAIGRHVQKGQAPPRSPYTVVGSMSAGGAGG